MAACSLWTMQASKICLLPAVCLLWRKAPSPLQLMAIAAVQLATVHRQPCTTCAFLKARCGRPPPLGPPSSTGWAQPAVGGGRAARGAFMRMLAGLHATAPAAAAGKRRQQQQTSRRAR